MLSANGRLKFQQISSTKADHPLWTILNCGFGFRPLPPTYNVDPSLLATYRLIHVHDFFASYVLHVLEGLNFVCGGMGEEKGKQENPQLV